MFGKIRIPEEILRDYILKKYSGFYTYYDGFGTNLELINRKKLLSKDLMNFIVISFLRGQEKHWAHIEKYEETRVILDCFYVMRLKDFFKDMSRF